MSGKKITWEDRQGGKISCNLTLSPQYQIAEIVEYAGKSYTVKRRMYDFDAESFFYICYRKGDRTMLEESQITSGSHQAS